MAVTPDRRRYQFSLKALFVVITIAAVSVGLLSWLRSQGKGDLEIDLSTGPTKTLFFHCANARDASDLADHFDNEAFLASVRKSLKAERKATPFAFYLGKADNGFFIKCDFPYKGTIADQRNADLHQAIDNAGRDYAASHSTIVGFEHTP